MSTSSDSLSDNFAVFAEKFPDVQTDRQFGFVVRDLRNPINTVFSVSCLTNIRCLIPHAYLDGTHGGILHDLDDAELFDKLSAISGLVSKDVYEASYDRCLELYRKQFPSTQVNVDIQSQIMQILRNIQSSDIAACKDVPRFCGSGGLLCKRDRGGRIDVNAGFVGRADECLGFACTTGNTCSKIFTVLQFLNASSTSDDFINEKNALFARTLHSLIGHRATLSLQVTQTGLKVLMMERLKKDQVKIFKWPPGNKYLSFTGEKSDERIVRLFMEISRISIECVPSKSEGPEESACGGPPPKRQKRFDDRVLFIHTSDGTRLTLTSLDVNARFSQDELNRLSSPYLMFCVM